MNDTDFSAATAAALDKLFDSVNRANAPGMVVGVARHGVPVYRRAFGMASLEHGVANNVATRMRIGSTSKHFAALAALLLAEDGKFDIDAGVRSVFPELADTGAEPTFRQLMHHTGGLRDCLDVGFIAAGLTIKPQGESLAVQARQRDVNFAPGAQMIYNNGGYQLLSLAIERAAGMPFERYLQERIFAPLGMLDTASVPSDFEIHPRMATMHVARPDGSFRRGLFPSEEVRGEGAIVSTIDDMLRWLRHLRGPHRVGSEAAWRQMLAPARLNNGFASSYAMGLLVEQYRGVGIVHHGGTVIGGTCQMLTVPEFALDIIILANGAAASPSELAKSVIDTVLGEAVLPLPAETPAMVADYAPMTQAVYASADGAMVAGFGDAGGKLGLVIHNSPPLLLRVEAGALCLDFSRSVTGPYRVDCAPLTAEATAPASLRLSVSGEARELARLAPPPSVRDAGAALLGHYSAPDLAADATIAFDGERLVLRIASPFGPNLLVLAPLSMDLFKWNFTGELAALGGTLHVEREGGAVTSLRLNTLRTRHLLFQRIGSKQGAAQS